MQPSATKTSTAHATSADGRSDARADGADSGELDADAATTCDPTARFGVPALVPGLEAQLLRNQRGRGVSEEVVQLRAVLAADLEYIAEAKGGDQRSSSSLTLEQCIRGNRRAVDHLQPEWFLTIIKAL